MSNLAAAQAVIALAGSLIQPDIIKVEGKPDVAIESVVEHAFELSGVPTVEDWNNLQPETREGFIVQGLRDWGLPVTHQAQVQVTGVANMSLQQQADTIRLNPGVIGFGEEAHAKAAEDEAAGRPLPEYTEHPLTAEGSQAANSADAGVTVGENADNAFAAGVSNGDLENSGNAPSSTTVAGEIEAANAAAAASVVEAPSTATPVPELSEGQAYVETSPAGDGWLVKFWDKTEKHFFATVEELGEALENYAHNHEFARTGK